MVSSTNMEVPSCCRDGVCCCPQLPGPRKPQTLPAMEHKARGNGIFLGATSSEPPATQRHLPGAPLSHPTCPRIPPVSWHITSLPVGLSPGCATPPQLEARSLLTTRWAFPPCIRGVSTALGMGRGCRDGVGVWGHGMGHSPMSSNPSPNRLYLMIPLLLAERRRDWSPTQWLPALKVVLGDNQGVGRVCVGFPAAGRSLGSPSPSYLFPSPAGLLQPYLGHLAEPAALAGSSVGIPHPGCHPGARQVP